MICNLRCWPLRNINVPIDYWAYRVLLGPPFAWVKYNDGEWGAILNSKGLRNCDGHEITEELREDLARTLRAPHVYDNYFYASGPGSPPKTDEDMQAAIEWATKHDGAGRYVSSSVFHQALADRKFWPMLYALRQRHVLIVGPPHLQGLKGRALPNATFIEIPEVNCFESRQSTIDLVVAACSSQHIDVISFSASMASEGMIYDLWDSLPPRPTMIDFGSLWDIFCGVQSRSLFRNPDLDWPEIIADTIRHAEQAEAVDAAEAKKQREQVNA